MKVAVVGARGFVGSALAHEIARSGRYQLIEVVRGDDLQQRLAPADIVVHAANPARRFQAENDPLKDFEETVEKTGRVLAAARGKRVVLVSSLSCRTQLHLAYGRHRRACEVAALLTGALVVRLGPMFGGNRTRDSLHDLLAGRPVYVAAETRYAYVDVAWAAQQLTAWLEGPTGLREIGARNFVRLAELRDRFQSSSSFTGADDTQLPEGFAEGPDAAEVFAFAERERARLPEWA